MNIELQNQKYRLQLAINWIKMIEDCETAINEGRPDTDWWIENKANCIAEYNNDMNAILINHINIDEIKNVLP
jgi:hypothetical protein